MNESGLIYGQPTALKDDLDQVAANILQKKVEAKDYYDPSKTVYEKIIRMNREEIDGMIAEVQMGMQAVGVSLGVIFRNYLHDGGIGVYEDGKKILVVFYQESVRKTTSSQRRAFRRTSRANLLVRPATAWDC